MANLNRPAFLQRIATLFRSHPMVGILGPRQCGKTTLARDFLAARSEPRVHYFDLEDPDRSRGTGGGDGGGLTEWRRLTSPSAAATRRKLRAVAPGMHDQGGVGVDRANATH